MTKKPFWLPFPLVSLRYALKKSFFLGPKNGEKGFSITIEKNGPPQQELKLSPSVYTGTLLTRRLISWAFLSWHFFKGPILFPCIEYEYFTRLYALAISGRVLTLEQRVRIHPKKYCLIVLFWPQTQQCLSLLSNAIVPVQSQRFPCSLTLGPKRHDSWVKITMAMNRD